MYRSSPAAEDEPLEAIVIPLFVKIAGGAVMATGMFTLGLAAQTMLLFRMRGIVVPVLGVMVVLGIAGVVTGWGAFRGRGAACIGAAVAAGLVAVLGATWAITGAMHGLVSPLSFLVPAMAVAGAVLAGVAIEPARKVTRAREALRARGLDFGM